MKNQKIKYPGVYIDERDAFPNSVVPVATAIPAFIGYTPQAMLNGKSCTNVPQRLTSYAEFHSIFCYPNPSLPASPAKQYTPEYYLLKQKSKPANGDCILIGDDFYSLVPDPSTIYYLYNSIKLFFENGGNVCYIVSVGSYGTPSKKPMMPGDHIVNSNVKLNDLMGGLALLKKEQEPTMYICPEATLLSVEENRTLMQEMLIQCEEMRTAVSIFDIIGGRNPDPKLFLNDIATFRNNTGNRSLNYGAAYFPFIGTIIMQKSDIDYTNLFGGDLKQLEPLLNPAEQPNNDVASILSNIESGKLTVEQGQNALIVASETYSQIIDLILADANILPPSGAVAGIITSQDKEVGPWQAPDAISIAGVASLPIRLSDIQQADLNVDAIAGKSINCIRLFFGIGFLIRGAKTLDGNSLDWRYLNVRRTMTFLEQSCKLACRNYVLEPNDKTTWVGVKAMISSFLTSVWHEGGLQGASSADAFNVECGLGSTMTADDILQGIMKVSIMVAISHPAEFNVIELEQKMAKSSQ